MLRLLPSLVIALLLAFWSPVGMASLSPSLEITGERESINLSGQMAVYRQQGKRLSLEQALDKYRDGRFEAVDSNDSAPTNFGLTSDQIWLSLEFSTGSEVSGPWYLEVGHASLDDVQLYLFQDGEPVFKGHSGDRLPFTSKMVSHRNHVFPVPLTGEQHYRLILSVHSEGTLTVPVTLWQGPSLWASDQTMYAMLSLYFGLGMALLVYNLFLFFSLRDRLYLTYVGFVACIMVGQAGLSGFTGQFLWPENAWLAHLSPTAGVSAAGIFGTLFVQRFLAGTPARLRLGWLMPSLSGAYAITFVTAVFGSYLVAAIAVNLISLILVVLALFMGAVSLVHREPGARFFVLAWVAFLAGVLVIALHNMGVLPSNLLTTNSMLIGSSMEMLLLSLALADRINELQRSRELAQAQALESRQKMLEVVQENERQLESRVAERTRELQAANRKLRESSRMLEKQANHDDLTGLANRKLLQDRLSGAKARARRSGEGFALIVVDLNKFKQINDTHGHTAGDAVLVAVANSLMAVPRETDTVARIGGDEFVLLLEGIRQREDLGRPLERLAAVGTQELSLPNGIELRVGLSIGVAMYPDDARDLDQLFSLADTAMYAHKSGRLEGAIGLPTAEKA